MLYLTVLACCVYCVILTYACIHVTASDCMGIVVSDGITYLIN